MGIHEEIIYEFIIKTIFMLESLLLLSIFL